MSDNGSVGPTHTPESVAEAIRPTLDAFTVAADPYCRKAAEDIYERLLGMTQDYLRENAEWNIGEDIRRCRRIELDNLKLRERNRDLAEALKEILGPLNVCSDNANVRDDEILPVDMTMGELRRARAALQKAGLSAGEGC